MIKPLSAILVSISWATSSWSQANVETGEHEAFTRLAINIPVGSEWSVTSNANGYIIELDSVKFGDLSGFYNIIPRDRIANAVVINDGFGLELTVDCECHHLVELWRPNWLLVDIHDGLKPEEMTQTLDDAGSGGGISNEAERAPFGRNISLPLVFEVTRNSGWIDSAVFQPPAFENEQGSTSPPFETLLTQVLGRALEQGIVDLVDPEIASISTNNSNSNVNVNSSVGLISETAFEVSDGPNSDEEIVSKRIECVENASIDFTGWGGGETFSNQIGGLRSALMGEFDEPNSEVILMLAQAYLYVGYGREANTVLGLDGRKSHEREILRTLSQIIDDDELDDPNFREQIKCETDVVLWAFLADPMSLEGDEDKVDEVIFAFKALPNILQVQLGPRLANALVEVGIDETVDAALLRTNDSLDHTIELDIVTAAIDQQQGNVDKAKATLLDLVKDNQRMSPDAIMDLIGIYLSGEDEIDSDVMAALETLRFELATDPQISQIEEKYILALVRNRQEIMALSALSQASDLFLSSESKALYNAIASSILDRGIDGVTLEFGFSDQLGNLNANLTQELANRIQEMGFPDRAIEIRGQINASEEEIVANSPVDQSPLNLGDDVLHWRSGDWTSLGQTSDPVLKRAAQLRLEEIEETEVTSELARSAEDLVQGSQLLRATISDLLVKFDTAE